MLYTLVIRRPGDPQPGTRWYFDSWEQREKALTAALKAGAVVTVEDNDYISDADEVARWLEEA